MKNFFSNSNDLIPALWLRYEKYLFAILLLVNIIPVVGVEYFFTGDGPAHLYNSNIILQLLSQEENRISQFFELRYELIPNLGGHVLLTGLNALLPAAVAEKVVYSLCLLLLPLSFRYVLSKFSNEAKSFALLAFPLAHNFCFYIGFQSFCLGMALMFFTFGYFLKLQKEERLLRYLLFALLLFITAIFHLFTAVATLLAVFIFMLIKILKRHKWNVRELVLIALACLPATIFCAIFIFGNSGEFQFNQTGFFQLLKGITAGIPIITIDTAEVRFSQPFNIMLCVGVMMVVIFRLGAKTSFQTRDFALITSVLLLVLYFILPDKMASGAFISMRLLLTAYLFLALWIGLFLRNNLISYLLMGAVVFLNLKMVHYHYLKARELSADAEAIHKAVDFIPAGSTMLPLNYSYHWLHYNIGLYPGGEKELIILDNYEASTTHFPVKWKEESFPGDLLGDFATNNRPLLKIDPYEDFSGQTVDAVLRWKHDYSVNDSITLLTDSLLKMKFDQVYVSPDKAVEVHLRKRKER